jgi:hypothetical protein
VPGTFKELAFPRQNRLIPTIAGLDVPDQNTCGQPCPLMRADIANPEILRTLPNHDNISIVNANSSGSAFHKSFYITHIHSGLTRHQNLPQLHPTFYFNP